MRILLVLSFTALLAGCTALTQSPLVIGLAALWPQAAPQQPALDPAFRYLRLTVEGRTVYLAAEPGEMPGMASVWYSGGREVVRLRDGRIVAAIGMKDEWRQVVLPPLPEWAALVERKDALRWVRTRDVMPGYRFGVRDDLILRRIAPPTDSQLKGIEAQTLIWFEERFEQPEVVEALPPARYAVQQAAQGARAVYGEQCLSHTLCFSWQQWPVAGRAQ